MGALVLGLMALAGFAVGAMLFMGDSPLMSRFKGNSSEVSDSAIEQPIASDEEENRDSGGVVLTINSVTVPDLRNMTPDEAQSALDEAGLVGEMGESVFDSSVSVGHVSAQDPMANEVVDEGSVIHYQLSKGQSTVNVPDVVGLDQSSATTLLEGAGFVVDVTYEQSSSYGVGTVMSQSITGAVAPGSTIGITVSSGAPKRQEPKNFPSAWAGMYEGSTSEADIITRPFTFTFDTVGNDGTLSGVCEVVDTDDKNAKVSSYHIKGYVDWDTDEFYVEGTSWINKGDLVAMGIFEGKVNYTTMTIVGLTWSEGEEHDRSWSAMPV